MAINGYLTTRRQIQPCPPLDRIRPVAASLINGKRNRRTKQEQRLLADYALQEGGKACEAGLKRETEIATSLRSSQ